MTGSFGRSLRAEGNDPYPSTIAKLTQQERQQINRRQNNLSHSIYQDKHSANVAHYGNNEVGQSALGRILARR